MIEDPTTMLAWLALLLVPFGIYFLLRARQLQGVEVLSRDQTNLVSTKLGLSGRPDRLIRLRSGAVIPKEKKSSSRLYDSHRIQVGAYLLLVEETYGVRPPYGVVVIGNGTEFKIRNTARLRAWTLRVAEKVRGQRFDPNQVARVLPTSGQCRSCGFRDQCTQRAA